MAIQSLHLFLIFINIKGNKQDNMSATYTAEFTSIKNVDYKIEIKTEKGSGTKTLQLSGNPLTTKMDSEGKHIYSQLKTVEATIGIMTKGLESDIYSGKAKGTSVKFTNTDTGKVEFVGYVTPCKYDQNWNEELEEVEVECVDGIAALKNIPYPVFGAMETFANIVFKCLKQSGCFTKLYVNDNVQLTASGTESIMEKLRVSQNDFFDEKEEGQTNDDVAMSCYDVLQEVMQFMGYTMFADGDEVYIIDYDAIKAGNNKYFCYSLANDKLGSYTIVEKKYSHNITGESIGETGTTVSLDKVYNKVTVKDDFYTYDSLFPGFSKDSTETNITPDFDTDASSLVTKRNYYVVDIIQQTDKRGNKENFEIFISSMYRGRCVVGIMKFYHSDVLQFCKYDKSTKQDVTSKYESSMCLSDMFKVHGATYVKMWKKEISGGDASNFKSNYNYMFDQATKIKKWTDLLNLDPQTIALSPYVLMTNDGDNHIGPAALQSTGRYDRTENEDCRKFPFIKLRKYDSSVFGGSDAYILLNGSQLSHDESNTPFPMSDGADNGKLKREKDYKYNNEGFMWCRMKWGGNYWNGTDWQTTPCDFKLQYWKSSQGNPRCKDYYDKWFEFNDTASKDIVKGTKGYYMPCPTNGNLEGDAEFIIYCNRDLWGDSRRSHWHSDNRYSRYYNYVQVLKDFTMTAEISNGMLDDMGNDTDTTYTNVIASGAVDKMSDIKFKICTYDHKKPSYSAVDYLVNGKSNYLKYTYNKALNGKESGNQGSNGEGAKMVQEEHLIFKLVNQYQEPRVVVKATLKNEGHKLYGMYTDNTIKGRTFIVSEANVDYKQDTVEMKLTEKF